MDNDITIEPYSGELPSDFADRLGADYAARVSLTQKKENGQFFTPIDIARFMGRLAAGNKPELKILDPGSGMGILACALIENLVSENPRLNSVELICYESDEKIIPYLLTSIEYLRKWLSAKNVDFFFRIMAGDFLLDHTTSLLKAPNSAKYDFIISNPPYFKVRKDNYPVQQVSEIVEGQTNIYTMFLSLSAKLLTEDGALIFIIPRSFASGGYFTSFRKFFFDHIKIEFVHLFVSRRDVFVRDKVLLETLILKGIRKQNRGHNYNMTISTSRNYKDLSDCQSAVFTADSLIDFNSRERIFHLPTTPLEVDVLRLFKSWSGNLLKFNIQISTGPVVAFRTRDYLRDEYANNGSETVPLLWLHNIQKMNTNWPDPKPGKEQYILCNENTKPVLLENKNLILLRRFSAKDDKSRLIAAPHFYSPSDPQFIGIENKLNYIYRPKGHLERSEILGITALLNSKIFDTYFRTFNGNVNVSATELREMSFPPLEQIKSIGETILLSNNFTQENITSIIAQNFELEGRLNEQD